MYIKITKYRMNVLWQHAKPFFFPFFLPFLKYKSFCYEFGDISRAELLEFIAIPYLLMTGTIFGVAPGCLLLPPFTIALVSFFN